MPMPVDILNLKDPYTQGLERVQQQELDRQKVAQSQQTTAINNQTMASNDLTNQSNQQTLAINQLKLMSEQRNSKFDAAKQVLDFVTPQIQAAARQGGQPAVDEYIKKVGSNPQLNSVLSEVGMDMNNIRMLVENGQVTKATRREPVTPELKDRLDKMGGGVPITSPYVDILVEDNQIKGWSNVEDSTSQKNIIGELSNIQAVTLGKDRAEEARKAQEDIEKRKKAETDLKRQMQDDYIQIQANTPAGQRPDAALVGNFNKTYGAIAGFKGAPAVGTKRDPSTNTFISNNYKDRSFGLQVSNQLQKAADTLANDKQYIRAQAQLNAADLLYELTNNPTALTINAFPLLIQKAYGDTGPITNEEQNNKRRFGDLYNKVKGLWENQALAKLTDFQKAELTKTAEQFRGSAARSVNNVVSKTKNSFKAARGSLIRGGEIDTSDIENTFSPYYIKAQATKPRPSAPPAKANEAVGSVRSIKMKDGRVGTFRKIKDGWEGPL